MHRRDDTFIYDGIGGWLYGSSRSYSSSPRFIPSCELCDARHPPIILSYDMAHGERVCCLIMPVAEASYIP